ncbi:MAG: hypothetical protein GY859_41690 [Desulfobacterales bacterium]|nr:hypothetical protein [Desulfobacterales bacterium]
MMENNKIGLPRPSIRIFIFALILNGLLVYALTHFFNVESHPDYYHTLARNLLEGRGFTVRPDAAPVMWRLPLYPLFLCGVYTVFGPHHLPVVVIQAVLNSVTCVLVFWLVRSVFSAGVGWGAALLFAVYPFTAYYAARELPETLFNCLFMIMALTLYRLYTAPRLKNAFLFGCMAGLLTLCKVFFKGFPVFLVCAMIGLFFLRIFRKARERTLSPDGASTGEAKGGAPGDCAAGPGMVIKRGALLAGVMFAGFFLVLSPWVIRNYMASGSFPVIGVGGGFTLWMGNHVRYDGMDFDQLPPDKREEMKAEMRRIIGDGYSVDLANDQKLYEEAVRNMLREPGKTCLLMVKKAFRLWFSIYSLDMKKHQPLVTVFQAVILLPALIGVLLALKRRRTILPLLLLLAYFQIVYTVFTPTIRYVMPVMPIVIGFAVYAVVNGLGRERERK